MLFCYGAELSNLTDHPICFSIILWNGKEMLLRYPTVVITTVVYAARHDVFIFSEIIKD
mgnify:CR=1